MVKIEQHTLANCQSLSVHFPKFSYRISGKIGNFTLCSSLFCFGADSWFLPMFTNFTDCKKSCKNRESQQQSEKKEENRVKLLILRDMFSKI
jgi:hypothetical protein